MQTQVYSISVLVPLPLEFDEQQLHARLHRTYQSLVEQGIDRWEMVVGVAAERRNVVLAWFAEWCRNKDCAAQGTTHDGSSFESSHEPNSKPNSRPKHAPSLFKQKLRLISCAVHDESGALTLTKLVQAARADWLSVIFAGDRLAPHFVYECLMRLAQRPSVQMLYFDDDVLKVRSAKRTTESYSRVRPQFKPDFSPDFLASYNYIGLSFVAMRERFVKAVTGRHKQSVNFPWQLVLDLSGAIMADHRLSLDGRCVALPAWHDDFPIQHIAAVLRHRDLSAVQSLRHETAMPALLAGRELVAAHLPEALVQVRSKRNMVNGKLYALKVNWPLIASSTAPKVSIIVPTKDQYAILKVCLESLLGKTQYPNYEVLVVDNQTTQVSALRYLKSIQARDDRVTVIRYDKPFNYSDINNQAVAVCKGEILLFLNNDVEVLNSDWLTEMVSHALRPKVGCVGAKLLYPDHTIQHAGVSLGMNGVADHMFRGMIESKANDPYGYLQCVRNTGAVTGAVMAIRRVVFEQIGGFDAKKLPVAFNDVDLCLKAEMAGYRTVWNPDACLIHHESKTRAPRRTKGDAVVSSSKASDIEFRSHATERSEIAYMRKSWGRLLKHKFRVLGQRHEPLRFF